MPGSKILHVNALSIRVNGTGNLRTSILGYDYILRQTLVPLAMTATSSREKVRLANFISQENMVKIETTQFGEFMRVNRVTIFVKPLWTEYPSEP